MDLGLSSTSAALSLRGAEATGIAAGPVLALCGEAGPDLLDLVAASRLVAEDTGFMFAWRVEDDRGDPKTAVDNASVLRAAGVNYVVGHFSDITALPASEAYGASGMLFLAPGCTHPHLCRPAAPTTLQFFGNDDEEIACILESLQDSSRRTLIISERSKSVGRIGYDLWRRLSVTHPCLEIVHTDLERAFLASLCGPTERVVIAGSSRFAYTIASLARFRAAGELILTHHAFTRESVQIGPPLENARVTSVKRDGGLLVDRSVDQVLTRAETLLGRPAGGYFETSYLAVRVLAMAWREVGWCEPERVERHLRAQGFRTPFGALTLSRRGQLTGHTWELTASIGHGSLENRGSPEARDLKEHYDASPPPGELNRL